MEQALSRLLKRFQPKPPVQARHIEPSLLISADDDESRPTPSLIDKSLRAIQAAREVDLHELSSRISSGPLYPDVWPGEHYKLLAGFVQILKPRLVIEIGTFQGLSALALQKFLPASSRLMTFDLKSWKEIPGTFLKESDFSDGRLTQHAADLTEPDIFSQFKNQLKDADFIFVDAAKDGIQEKILLDHFEKVEFTGQPLVFFDDTRLWNMLRIWREVRRPKLDLTSFGHWSGSGVIEWG